MAIYAKDEYFEAKLQLRPNDKELIDYAKGLIDKNKDILISKETEYKYGVDFTTTSQKQTQNIARQLKRRFKGKITISRKLFKIHRLTSKKVYRVTVCFRKDL